MSAELTFPLTPPATPGAVSISWNLLTVTAVAQSPFTLRTQMFSWPGQKLGAVVTMPVMKDVVARPWRAFFAALRGREGTFTFGDSSRLCKRETALGIPETVGTTQGRQVASTNWTPSTNVLKAGEMVRIGAKLRYVLEDVSSDADGNATFSVFPDLQSIAAETEIIWQSPQGVFRLDQDPPELVWRVDGLQDGFTFTIIEA